MMRTQTTRWDHIVALTEYAFQPIVNIHTGIVYGYEALIRQVETAGFGGIDAFFDAAQKEGVLSRLHQQLLLKAAAKFTQLSWHREARLFFNLDSRLFGAAHENQPILPSLPDGVAALNSSVCLEISEQHEIFNTVMLSDHLERLRDEDFRIAVDDFGAGFSSLKLLYFIRPEYIKIDRFYIKGIEKDMYKRTLAASIVNIAHLLGSLVIAEGVETEAEYYCCKQIGCDLLQGYLVQKPQVDMTGLVRHYEKIQSLTDLDKRSSTLKDTALIESEIAYIEAIDHKTPMIDALELFKDHQNNSLFPIINENQEPIGVLRERDVKSFVYAPYGRYILANRSFGNYVKTFMSKIPMVDIHTRLERILEIISINDDLEGILITRDMRYLGFLSTHSLLKILNEKNLAAARDQNPLTKLPGNERIYAYVSEALQDTRVSYGLIYFDFDNFKAYNDRYGFRQGDRVILLFAELLRKSTKNGDRFAGHVGGDDFFMGVKGISVEALVSEVNQIAARFREDVESFYDTVAIGRGWIEACDREGKIRNFPLITVSSAVLTLPAHRHRFYSAEELSTMMAGMKKTAKQSAEKICILNLDNIKRHSAQEPLPRALLAPMPYQEIPMESSPRSA